MQGRARSIPYVCVHIYIYVYMYVCICKMRYAGFYVLICLEVFVEEKLPLVLQVTAYCYV